MTPRSLARVAGLAALGLIAACAQIPRSGPVVEVRDRQQATDSQGLYYNPPGPQPGDSPEAIVTGFLVAMTATPLQTLTAKEFLSPAAQAAWQPERVIAYGSKTPSHGSREVVVHVHGADQVGTAGQWLGAVRGSDRRLAFPMVEQGGQWRIAQVPNALIVPRTFYDQEYQEAEVYFFDPSGRILVPEPVHVPQVSLASALVRGLVRGPGRSLNGVARTFLPPGLSPQGLSVPVTAGGTANVTLRGQDPGQLSPRTTQRILSQLSWTLRQDASIHSFRVNIAGRQLTGSDGAQVFRVGDGSNDPRDPAATSTSPSYSFALKKGRLVSGQISNPSSVDGPFGETAMGLRTFAVSLRGQRVAGVTRTELLVGSVTDRTPAQHVLFGSGLLRPSWDFAGRLWEMQNTPSGARVLYVDKGQAHRLRVPGISGENVRRFLVSRDGSRLVAVIRGSASDRMVVSRIRYDADGRPEGGADLRRIPWLSRGSARISDIGWTSPTTIEVLDQLSRSQAEARILNVDGSTTADEAPAVPIPGHALGLVTSPAGDPPYAVRAGQLFGLATVDTAPATINVPGLHHITYVG